MICPNCEVKLTGKNSLVIRSSGSKGNSTSVKCFDCQHEEFVDVPSYVSSAQAGEATVVHRDANGNYRFPGRADAAVPAGYERIELRTVAERDRFEREVNVKERTRWEQLQHGKDMAFGGVRAQNRSDLRTRMQSMSNLGRDFANIAMRHNDNLPRERYEAGFHIESNHWDSRNRLGEKSEHTGWKRRKG